MRSDGRLSENVEYGGSGGSSGGRLAIGGGMGTIAFVVLAILLGVDPGVVLNEVGNQAAPQQQQGPARPDSPETKELKRFVSVVLADTEDVWREIFRDAGKTYRDPRLVIFSGQVQSACGRADSSMGPFYCPGDSKVYIDLQFYSDLKNRFKAPGDFAQAYVIAHEVGHHVQNLLGISDKVHRMQQQVSRAEANALSVRLELQADFFAGVWAHHANKARHVLEEGDVEEAMRAATAIGDDRLQMQTQGRVVPDSFTHGTSAQRVRWFKKGLETGDINQGNTFAVKDKDL